MFEVDNIKNEAIPRDFLQKWKVDCWADGLVPMRLAMFQRRLCRALRLPRKSDARSYEVLHLSRKIIFANLKIWCSKMQPLSGDQRPDLLTSLMNMSFVPPATRNASLRTVFGNATKPSRHAHLWNGAQSLAPAKRNDIWTAKSGPSMWCFSHLDLEMCFAPQWRALFQHLNFQKWSEHGVRCTFWLRNVLPATTTCASSSSRLARVVWDHQFFTLLTSTCALRHNSVRLFIISTSKSGLRRSVFYTFDFEMCFAPQQRAIFHLSSPQMLRARFSQPTFRPSGATNHWKNTVFRDSATPASSFFWLFLFSDLHSSSLLFSDSSHLCFSICPYCRKFDF